MHKYRQAILRLVTVQAVQIKLGTNRPVTGAQFSQGLALHAWAQEVLFAVRRFEPANGMRWRGVLLGPVLLARVRAGARRGEVHAAVIRLRDDRADVTFEVEIRRWRRWGHRCSRFGLRPCAPLRFERLQTAYFSWSR